MDFMDRYQQADRERAWQVYRIRQAVNALQSVLDAPIISNIPRTVTNVVAMLEGKDRLTELDAAPFVENLMKKHEEQMKPKMAKGKLSLVSSKG